MRRIIALFLIICMAGIPVFSKAQDNYDARAQIVLQAAGADTSFGALDAVSRGRFVAAIVDFIGAVPSVLSPFYDVGAEYEYYSQICAAYEAELISGREDRMFYPNESITYNEAISICIAATGRKMYAAAHGGYPGGFNYAADAAGLGKNVSARGDTALSGYDAVWLLFNTFSTEFYEPESFGADIKFGNNDGETLFSRCKNIKSTEGIVNANRYSGLYSAGEGYVHGAKIGELEANDENGLCDDLLGYYVEVYYTETDSEARSIKACFSVDKKNTVIQIDADDCVRFNDNYFTYEINGRNKTEKISPSVPVVYNRCAVSERQDSLFTPEMGYVQLIDNNSDGKTDVVNIIEREDYVIFAYDKANEILYDKYNKSLDLSVNTDKFTVLRSAGGEILAPASLEEKMVVTAEVSLDKKVVYAVVCTEKRYGGVTQTETEEDYTKVTVSEEELYLSPVLRKNMPQGMSGASNGIFYLNAYGYIADFELTEEEFVYIISMYNIEEEGTLELRCMDRNGEILLLHFRDKYTINGKSARSDDGIPNIMQRGDVAVISRNSQGEITSVRTPDSSSGIFSFGDMASLTYSKALYSFNGRFIIGENTVIMEWPMPSFVYDEDEYRILDKNELADGESYTVRAFVTAENSIIPKVIVVYSSAENSISRSDDCVLVKKIYDTVNDDNEQIRRIYFYRRDKESYVDCIDPDMIDNEAIGVGDIIKFSVNRRGYMTGVDKIYSAKTNSFNSKSSFAKDNGTRNSFRLVGGQLYNREENVIGLYDGNPAGISRTAAEYFTIPEKVTGSIYVVDTDSKEIVKRGGLYSLRDYCHFGEASKVLIYTRYAVMLMVVVYE